MMVLMLPSLMLVMLTMVDGIVYNPHPPSKSPNLSDP
jgi:hypothetical protein